MPIRATVCFVISDKKVLLIKKSEELFGGGKWNGLGGKMQADEGPEQGCVREVFEESGLNVSKLRCHGLVKFWFGDRSKLDWVVYVFSTNSFEGEPKESSEGTPRWTELDKIPYDEMWEDNQHWLPFLLDGKSFNGEFYFNEDGTKLLDHKIEVK